MKSIDDLNQTFRVESIMTPVSQLKTWELGAAKEPLLNSNGSLVYDVIPVTEAGSITGVMTSAQPFERIPLSHKWLISRDTPILDLVDLFIASELPAFLVLFRQEVTGIVSLADLNKFVVRLFIYNLTGELELALQRRIRSLPEMTYDRVISSLSQDRRMGLNAGIIETTTEDLDVEIYQHLYLSDLINICENDKQVMDSLGFPSRNYTHKKFSGLNDLRNQGSHPVRPVLSKREELPQFRDRLKRLQELIGLCQTLPMNH